MQHAPIPHVINKDGCLWERGGYNEIKKGNGEEEEKRGREGKAPFAEGPKRS